MRALVTGGAGFIGSALCKQLVAQGWTVTVLDALSYAGCKANLEPELSSGALRLIEASICDPKVVAETFATADPTHVFHLAAETHVDRSIDGPAAFVETNMVGTAILLDAARTAWTGDGTRRFIHVSTDEVFGALDETGAFSETSPYAPNSPYAASKAGADHLARAWKETYGLPVIVTNCSNNYGPRQFPEKLIPLMILKALAGDALPVYGEGRQVRDWIHVDDHAAGLIAAAERGRIGETYLLGAEDERQNIDVVNAIASLMDKRFPDRAPHSALITHVDDRPGHDFRYAIDPSKAQRELEWSPKSSFDAGLAETVDWYLENETWWRAVQDGSYRGERLGRA